MSNFCKEQANCNEPCWSPLYAGDNPATGRIHNNLTGYQTAKPKTPQTEWGGGRTIFVDPKGTPPGCRFANEINYLTLVAAPPGGVKGAA